MAGEPMLNGEAKVKTAPDGAPVVAGSPRSGWRTKLCVALVVVALAAFAYFANR